MIPSTAPVEFAAFTGSNAKDLLCPICGSGLLHHDVVTVYQRNEDTEVVRKTSVVEDSFRSEIVWNNDSGNPSARRDGLVISFWCENCGGTKEGTTIELTIAQHKGNTQVGWRFSKPTT